MSDFQFSWRWAANGVYAAYASLLHGPMLGNKDLAQVETLSWFWPYDTMDWVAVWHGANHDRSGRVQMCIWRLVPTGSLGAIAAVEAVMLWLSIRAAIVITSPIDDSF